MLSECAACLPRLSDQRGRERAHVLPIGDIVCPRAIIGAPLPSASPCSGGLRARAYLWRWNRGVRLSATLPPEPERFWNGYEMGRLVVRLSLRFL